jgi:hypothetical protein
VSFLIASPPIFCFVYFEARSKESRPYYFITTTTSKSKPELLARVATHYKIENRLLTRRTQKPTINRKTRRGVRDVRASQFNKMKCDIKSTKRVNTS